MTEKLQIWKCPLCGNMVESIRGGGGSLVCCGIYMILESEEKNGELGKNHIPVVWADQDVITASAGQTPHPMTSEHHIEWIEIHNEQGFSQRLFLKPGDLPQSFFQKQHSVFTVRVYCNIHGLWKGEPINVK